MERLKNTGKFLLVLFFACALIWCSQLFWTFILIEIVERMPAFYLNYTWPLTIGMLVVSLIIYGRILEEICFKIGFMNKEERKTLRWHRAIKRKNIFSFAVIIALALTFGKTFSMSDGFTPRIEKTLEIHQVKEEINDLGLVQGSVLSDNSDAIMKYYGIKNTDLLYTIYFKKTWLNENGITPSEFKEGKDVVHRNLKRNYCNSGWPYKYHNKVVFALIEGENKPFSRVIVNQDICQNMKI